MNIQEKYFQLLQKQYPTADAVISEIVNLEAILSLPKGTEHFISDVHGEYDAFQHVLRNGSGNVKEKIKACFGGVLTTEEQQLLATIIYYPEEKLTSLKNQELTHQLSEDWYSMIIEHLVELVRFCSTKYTRSKVRKSLPLQFSYVLEELLYKTEENGDKKAYYSAITNKIINLSAADELITALSYTIQRLVVDHLHVVGDIYDRGPAPDKIIDTLIDYHSVDIQWGNHDITWIGAAGGSAICIANVLRICARYGNLDIVEDRYGINLRPLLSFAQEFYVDNPVFRPKLDENSPRFSEEEILEITQIHQAVAILQFKLEAALIKRNSEFKMNHRLLLDHINFEENTINLHGNTYHLSNTCFATINPKQPEQLTSAEIEIIQKLVASFKTSERLRRHVNFFMTHGSMYLVYNENLLIHGCIPLNQDGSFQTLTLHGVNYSGKKLLDEFERSLRMFYQKPKQATQLDQDLVWYLWTGACSSLFGKEDMTTFERYFIQDKATHFEKKNAYFKLRNEVSTGNSILKEFHINPKNGHIINGHTPVKEIEGENPIKAEGKVIVIDGGFSKPYQKTTGIAGYTLLYNSYGLQLVAHQSFTSKKDAIENETDILSVKRVIARQLSRKRVRETSIGLRLQSELNDLEDLLTFIRQKDKNINSFE